jgi:hypothetical protein
MGGAHQDSGKAHGGEAVFSPRAPRGEPAHDGPAGGRRKGAPNPIPEHA